MKSTLRVVLFAVAMLVPAYASAAWSFSFSWGSGNICTANYLQCLGSDIIYVINTVLVPVLFAFAFIVFLYGVFKTYIWSVGNEEEVTKGHKLILWGLVGFAVMISVWGLVNVVANTFGLAGYGAPPYPTAYPQGGAPQGAVMYIQQ